METPNTEHNAFNLNGLSHNDRKMRLYHLVKAFPAYVPYSERMHTVAAQTGISPKTLYQLAKRNGWQARLAAEIAAEQERAEYNARLEVAAPRSKEVGAIQIANSIRGTAFTLLTASRRFIDTCCQMLQYYSDLIALKIAQAGGLAFLDAPTAKEIAELQGKLSFYAKQLQPYMQPSAIATLLGIIDYTAPANEEEIETTHFTAHALQKRLLELGMTSGPAFANPEAALADFIPEEGLPELSGWQNARPEERLLYGLPPAAYESKEATA
jgi:hypothetical protein